MGKRLGIEKGIVALAGGIWAIAALSQPAWGISSPQITDWQQTNSIHQSTNYEPPDNGKPDSTGDTGGR